MSSFGALHNLHSPKGHCANCAAEMPGLHISALCSDCATVQIERPVTDPVIAALLSRFPAQFLRYELINQHGLVWAGGKHIGGGVFDGR